MIARIVDGSKFDEFKAFYGDTLVTGAYDVTYLSAVMNEALHFSTFINMVWDFILVRGAAVYI